MAENPTGTVLNEAFHTFVTDQLKAQGKTPDEINATLAQMSQNGGQMKPMDMLAMAANALGAPKEATELLNVATGGQLAAFTKYGPFAIPMAARKFAPGLYFKFIDFIERKIPFIGPLLERAHLWVNGVLDSNSMLSIPVKLAATIFRLGESDDKPRPHTAEELRTAAANMPILKGGTTTAKPSDNSEAPQKEQKPDALADMFSDSYISQVGYAGFIANLSRLVSLKKDNNEQLKLIANKAESFVSSVDSFSSDIELMSAQTALSAAIKNAKESTTPALARNNFSALINDSFNGALFSNRNFAIIFAGLCSAYSNENTPAADFLKAISQDSKQTNLQNESSASLHLN